MYNVISYGYIYFWFNFFCNNTFIVINIFTNLKKRVGQIVFPNDAIVCGRILPSRAAVLLSPFSSALTCGLFHTQIYLFCSSSFRWASPYRSSFTSYLLSTHFRSLCIHPPSPSISYTYFQLLHSHFHLPSDSLVPSPLLLHTPTTAALGPSSGKDCWSGNLPGWLRG